MSANVSKALGLPSASWVAQAEVKGTGTAPLLYWLAVVCGLTGITVLRIDEPAKVVPLWFGAIVGISLGQLIAILRIRIWTAGLFALMSSWIIGPAIYIGLCELFGFGTDTETALMALIPAFVCGYASLTERGGLLAFWYPAMLWMLVILDGEAPGSFAPRAYLPMAIGLGVFFIAFLRARETRRAQLWRAYSHVRLAKPGESAVLHGSPVRAISSLAFTMVVGSGAFLLAAWVAPNLFQKDRALHHKMTQIPPPPRWDNGSNLPCCPESWATERTKEYLPLQHEQETARVRSSLNCSYCPAPVPTESHGPYGYYRGAGVRYMGPGYYYGYDYYGTSDYVGPDTYAWNTPNYGTDYHTSYGNNGGGYGYDSPHVAPVVPPVSQAPTYWQPPTVDPAPAYVPPPVDTPKPVVTHKPTPKKPIKVAPTATWTPPPVAPVVHTPKPVVATPEPPKPQPVPAPENVAAPAKPSEPPMPSAPWGVLLPLLAGVFLVPMGTRFVRRQVTLRHLARPFWHEPIDQRISNHWQRMLVGLRDAGIQLRNAEQPGAFARRVAIKGMEDCATILERVRHGVRVEEEDLVTMGKATDEIYGTARKKAGVAGRIAATFRWPLV